MSLRRATPLTFNPRGLSDALDGSNVFAGAMASLQNLVPDPSTRALWQCRPASTQIVNFTTAGGPFSSGFSSGFQHSAFLPPIGLISCLKVIGNIAYGMVASALNPGNDQPFAYNLLTGGFLNVTGITGANTPVSPPSSGAWTPPKMALVGTNLLVTHPGFTGAGGVYFGWFDISNPAAPTWSGGNLTGAVTFTTPPSCVENFNGRAYWITNPPTGQPALIFSDVLVPRTVTNANQVLTFDDNVPLTALGLLGLEAPLTGGVVQALIVFKGVSAIYQITGDAAQSNLSRNALSVPTGTLAPNTVKATPKGLAFAAPDGLRMIDYSGHVSDPIGLDGMGKNLPFIYSVVPSRMTAAVNGAIYRVTTQDGSLVGSPNVEYWYDMMRQTWSGPHTFPASCIEPWQNTFVVAPIAVPGSLWQSDYVQSATSTFTENGVALSFTWTTCMLPDTNQMAENAMLETTVYMSMAPGASYSIAALNQNQQPIQSAAVANANASSTIWGSFTWGSAPWGGPLTGLFPILVPWSSEVVFRRMQLSVTGQSAASVRIGTAHFRYQQLGYIQQSNAA